MCVQVRVAQQSSSPSIATLGAVYGKEFSQGENLGSFLGRRRQDFRGSSSQASLDSRMSTEVHPQTQHQ